MWQTEEARAPPFREFRLLPPSVSLRCLKTGSDAHGCHVIGGNEEESGQVFVSGEKASGGEYAIAAQESMNGRQAIKRGGAEVGKEDVPNIELKEYIQVILDS